MTIGAEQDVVGVLLAAGAGRRAGGAKALRSDPDGTSWLVRSSLALLEGGCSRVVVVLGSEAAAARQLLESRLSPLLGVVVAPDWREGMGASLQAGLTAARQDPVRAVMISLVDLPDVGAPVVRRVLEQAPPTRTVLARASYRGVPGHPVLIGADHLSALLSDLSGDQGARDYLSRHSVGLVGCGDLASGVDQDGPS